MDYLIVHIFAKLGHWLIYFVSFIGCANGSFTFSFDSPGCETSRTKKNEETNSNKTCETCRNGRRNWSRIFTECMQNAVVIIGFRVIYGSSMALAVCKPRLTRERKKTSCDLHYFADLVPFLSLACAYSSRCFRFRSLLVAAFLGVSFHICSFSFCVSFRVFSLLFASHGVFSFRCFLGFVYFHYVSFIVRFAEVGTKIQPK